MAKTFFELRQNLIAASVISTALRLTAFWDRSSSVKTPSLSWRHLNRLTPNDPYSGRTAPLTSKRSILYIYSTNIGTEYFKHGLYSLQNAVCFIILTYLVPVLFTLYIYSTNIGTEYFKRGIYSSFFFQNAVCFIILTCLVPVLFTFYIQSVPQFKKNNSGAKRLIEVPKPSDYWTFNTFSLQNAVCFIILTCLVPELYTFCIQNVLKFKKNNSGTKRLIEVPKPSDYWTFNTFSLQNAVCFIILTCLVPELYTFYIQDVLKFKKYIISAPKGKLRYRSRLTIERLTQRLRLCLNNYDVCFSKLQQDFRCRTAL